MDTNIKRSREEILHALHAYRNEQVLWHRESDMRLKERMYPMERVV